MGVEETLQSLVVLVDLVVVLVYMYLILVEQVVVQIFLEFLEILLQ